MPCNLTAYYIHSKITWHFYFLLRSVTLQYNTNLLINYKYDQGCQCIFKNIKRRNDQQCKSQQPVYRAVYCASHLDKSLDWHSKSLTVSRKQHKGIDKACKDRCQNSSNCHTCNCMYSALFMTVFTFQST